MRTMRLTGIMKGKYLAQPRYTVSYLLAADSAGGEETGRSVTLPPGIPTRDMVVNAVITDVYPSDRMQAVQNNYLLDPDDADARAEMDEMQQFRKDAKAFADEIMEFINNSINLLKTGKNEEVF